MTPRIFRAWLSYLFYAHSNRLTLSITPSSNFVSFPLELNGNTLFISREVVQFIQSNLHSSYGLSSPTDLAAAMNADSSIIGWSSPLFWNQPKFQSSVASELYPLFFSDLTSRIVFATSELELNLMDTSFHLTPEYFTSHLGYTFSEIDNILYITETQSLSHALAKLIQVPSSTPLDEVLRSFTAGLLQRQDQLRVTVDGSSALFQLTFNKFSTSFQRELQWFFEHSSKDDLYLRSNSPASSYLLPSSTPSLRIAPIVGTNLAYAPEREQTDALQLAAASPVLSVAGPPGCGKTFLIRGLLGQQICSRALRLARGDSDRSNLTLITSSVFRAIDNAVSAVDTIDTGPYINGVVFFDRSGERLSAVISEKILELETQTYSESAFTAVRDELLQLHSDLRNTPELQTSLSSQEELRDRLSNLEYKTLDIAAEMQDTTSRLQELVSTQVPAAFGTEDLFETDLRVLQHFLRASENCSSLLGRLRSKHVLNKFIANNLVRLQRFKEAFPEVTGSRMQQLRSYVQHGEALASILQKRSKEMVRLETLDTQRRSIEEQSLAFRQKLSELDQEVSTYSRNLVSRVPSTDTLAQHQRIYQLSLKLLHFYAVKHRDEVLEALDVFIQIFGSFAEDRQGAQAAKYFSEVPFEVSKWFAVCFPFACATLDSISHVFPFQIPELFDLAVIDEAAFVRCHEAFPAVYRASRVVYTGDLRQLRPKPELTARYVIEMRDNIFPDARFYRAFSPTDTTALHRAAREDASEGTGFQKLKCDVSLTVTRRNHKDIVQLYKVFGGYDIISEAHESEETTALVEQLGGRIFYVDSSDTPTTRSWTTNMHEVNHAESVVNVLLEIGFLSSQIAVLTAYEAQVPLLSERLSNILSWKNIGDVHKFQGKEADVVILSTVFWNKTHRAAFCREPNLLNTAISRSRSVFIGISNFNRLLADDRWGRLYIERLTELGEPFFEDTV